LKSYPGNCKISFVKLKSYEGDMSSGKVNEIIGLNEIDQNETIVVIEDIVDTGTTLSKISDILEVMNRPWLIVSLFFKPQAFIGTRKIDFVGFQIPNNFIVGYGLDYNGFGRNLKNIYQLAKA
jgi:hypoxanthine phosphoribosyltransferase